MIRLHYFAICFYCYFFCLYRRKRTSDDLNVLDLACGKGGDLLKWEKGKVDHVIAAGKLRLDSFCFC